MTLSIDGVRVTTLTVSDTAWSDYTFGGTIAAGSHVLSLSYTDSSATSPATLYLDSVGTFTGPIVEEFLGKQGSVPSAGFWRVQIGAGWDTGIQTYSAGNVSLDGQGHLVIQATKIRNGYQSGRVESINKLSLGYGTITARIKVPAGQGLWPAFWLVGSDISTVPWPQSGEIDVMELPSTTTAMYSTLHGPISGTSSTQQAQIASSLPDLSAGYHNFWVRHLVDEITFGVDDRTLGTLTPSSLSPGSTWVYNRPMSVILNLAVGGPWAGAPTNQTRFPAQMIVDSIVWVPA